MHFEINNVNYVIIISDCLLPVYRFLNNEKGFVLGNDGVLLRYLGWSTGVTFKCQYMFVSTYMIQLCVIPFFYSTHYCKRTINSLKHSSINASIKCEYAIESGDAIDILLVLSRRVSIFIAYTSNTSWNTKKKIF